MTVSKPARAQSQTGDIRFIESKYPDQQRINTLLSISQQANHWTNFGPVSRLFEKKVEEYLQLPATLKVVGCCNATTATHALANLLALKSHTKLRWAISAFGFYSSIEGPLQSALILDCDTRGMLCLKELEKYLDKFDAFIVTNVFGLQSDLSQYQEFAMKHEKLMITDSAMALGSHSHAANECISFHHTKPWGFGEAGCAIVDRRDERLFRELISFGHIPDQPLIKTATNGKISDIACAYVIDRLDSILQFKESYSVQYQRILEIGESLSLPALSDRSASSIPGNVAFTFPFAVNSETIFQNELPLAKYYYPLSNDCPRAVDLYQRMVNVPCHSEIAHFSDEEIYNCLKLILTLDTQKQ